MTDQSDMSKNSAEKTPESFPKTTMMPSGWDFLSEPEKKAGEVIGDQKEVTETQLPQSSLDKLKFPEPDAFPKGWNIAED
jgi:hypothetical protein